jgi:hypothetical protein
MDPEYARFVESLAPKLNQLLAPPRRQSGSDLNRYRDRPLLARSGHKALRWLQLWASAAKAASRSRTHDEQRLHVFAACH